MAKRFSRNKNNRHLKAHEFSARYCLLIVAASILIGIVFNSINPIGITLVPEFWLDNTVSHVAPQIAAERYWKSSLFVDARPNSHYKRGHIETAVNIPLNLFDTLYMMELDKVDKNKTIIVYGRTKSRLYDVHVSRKLILRGHTNTMILNGSLAAWKKKGYPVKS
jgi:rhodanese-related sulfurtransferase